MFSEGNRLKKEMLAVMEGKELYPLSDAQVVLRWSETFAFEHKKAKEGSMLNFAVRFPNAEGLPVADIADWMEKAFNEVVKNNDSLRLHIVRTIKGLRQYVEDYAWCPVERIAVDGEEGYQKALENISQYKISWLDEKLLLAKIYILSDTQCGMAFRIHHAVFDGTSISIFFEQFKKYYTAFAAGKTPEPPARNYSVLQYFKNSKAYKKSEQYKIDRKYWFKAFMFQRKYSFPAGQRALCGTSQRLEMVIDGELYQATNDMAKQLKCSLPGFLMAIAALTTYAITGKENFCIFSLSHGRLSYVLRKTIGCMMNTVPIFFDIGREQPTVAAFIQGSFSNYMEAYAHASFPMSEQMIFSFKEAILHGFNFNPSWLVFSWMDFGEQLEAEDMQLTNLPIPDLQAQLYLALLNVAPSHLTLGLEYQIHKYTAEQADGMLHTFRDVLKTVLENAERPMPELCALIRKKKRKK